MERTQGQPLCVGPVEFVPGAWAFLPHAVSEDSGGVGLGKPDDVDWLSRVCIQVRFWTVLSQQPDLLEILLESIRSILPRQDQEGRSIALVTLVSGLHWRVQWVLRRIQ